MDEKTLDEYISEEKFDKFPFGYILNIINRKYTKKTNENLSKLNVTRSEYPFLMKLYSADNITQDELSHFFNLNNATVTRALVRLEKKELIQRQIDDDDKRKKIVILTPKGRKISKEIKYRQEKLEEELFSEFSSDELKQFQKHLLKLFKTI